MNLRELDALPTTVSVEQAAAALGIGRALAYDLIRQGRFPVPILRLGRRLIVPTVPLVRTLGLEPALAANASGKQSSTEEPESPTDGAPKAPRRPRTPTEG